MLKAAPDLTRARCRAWRSIAAARAISRPCATALSPPLALAEALAGAAAPPEELREAATAAGAVDAALAARLGEALAESLPLQRARRRLRAARASIRRSTNPARCATKPAR